MREVGPTVDDRRADVSAGEHEDSDVAPFAVDRDGLLTLLAHLDQSVIGLRFDGTITFASPSIETLLGWDARALVGESLLDYLPADTLGPMAAVPQPARQVAAATSPGDARARCWPSTASGSMCSTR